VTRRFVLQENVNQINIDAIRANCDLVFRKNNGNRLVFCVLSDLTTFVHVGDLLEIDFSSDSKSWRIIELKTGVINNKLEDVLAMNKESFEEAKALLSKNEKDQLNRIIKQKDRSNKVSILCGNPDTVHDIQLDKDIHLGKDVVQYDGYGQELEGILKDADKTGGSFKIIDGCLYLVCVRGGYQEAVHVLHHLISQEGDCSINGSNPGKAVKELEAINQLANNKYLVDLCQSSMCAQSSTPFFLYPMRKRYLFKLLFDKMTFLSYLDIKAFLALCLKSNLKFNLCGGEQTNKIRVEYGRDLVPECDGKAIEVTVDEDFKVILLGGTLHKLWFEFMRPGELIGLWKYEAENFKKESNPD